MKTDKKDLALWLAFLTISILVSAKFIQFTNNLEKLDPTEYHIFVMDRTILQKTLMLSYALGFLTSTYLFITIIVVLTQLLKQAGC